MKPFLRSKINIGQHLVFNDRQGAASAAISGLLNRILKLKGHTNLSIHIVIPILECKEKLKGEMLAVARNIHFMYFCIDS